MNDKNAENKGKNWADHMHSKSDFLVCSSVF